MPDEPEADYDPELLREFGPPTVGPRGSLVRVGPRVGPLMLALIRGSGQLPPVPVRCLPEMWPENRWNGHWRALYTHNGDNFVGLRPVLRG